MQTYNFIIKSNKIENSLELSTFINEKNILVQIFCGTTKEDLEKVSTFILEKLPQAICIGSSTDGEIKEKTVTTKELVVSISIFEKTTLKTSFVNKENSFENGFELAKKLSTKRTKLLITFTDGHKTNGEEFLKGIKSFDRDLMVAGGMAADNASFTQTYICCQNKILTAGCVAVALDSDELQVANAYNFNWSPIGISHTIEEVKDNRVYKISGLTPLEFYKKYLGEYVAKSLPATGIEFPLIVQNRNIPIARAVIRKHEDGSLCFAGNLNKGDKVKLGFGNIELIMNNPMQSLFKDYNVEDSESFFIYSCMARRRYMPSLIELEIEPFSQLAPTSGFFTYGEFYHYKTRNELLNQTFTIVALSEGVNKEKKTKRLKVKQKKISEHARSLEALTHLIQQSSKDYTIQSKQLEIKTNYAQNILLAQKQFLKHAVHETNTPLSIIMGNIEMFEMEHGKNKYLSNIEVAMKNVFNIYDDLSYLIKKDYVSSATHNINLVDFLRSRIDFFFQSAKKAKLDFNFQSNKKEIIINFNEIKLQRIVDNNLTNAIKYTFAGEVINVVLDQVKDKCNLRIKSNSKQILDPHKIFEEYYREEGSKEGFGLGLNLVKRICDEEGVEINLESNEKCSSFTYTFKGIK